MRYNIQYFITNCILSDYVPIISPPFMTIIVSIFAITPSNTVHVNTIRVLSTIIANVCSKLKKYDIFYLFAVMSHN